LRRVAVQGAEDSESPLRTMFRYFRAGAQGKVILSEAKKPALCLSKPGRQILRFAQNDGGVQAHSYITEIEHVFEVFRTQGFARDAA
jgi:hypothetical protein